MVIVPGVRVMELATMVAITGERDRSGTATTASDTFERGSRTVTATSQVATHSAQRKNSAKWMAAIGWNVPSCSGARRPGPPGKSQRMTATAIVPPMKLPTEG